MRVVLLGFLAAFLALALGVAAHHAITTGHAEMGAGSLLAVCVGCSVTCAIAVRAAKEEPRLWPRAFSGALLIGLASVYVHAIVSPIFPFSLKVMHATGGAVILTWAILLLYSRPKNSGAQQVR